MTLRTLTALGLFSVLAGCGSTPKGDGGITTPDDHKGPVSTEAPCSAADRLALRCATLASYPLFAGSGATAGPAAGVTPYEVTAPLFSDGARKQRYVYVPPGAKVRYQEGQPWDLPVGALLAKTFAFPIDERDPAKGLRVVETRLVSRTEEGYVAVSYVWNETQTEARRAVAGADVPLKWLGEDGREVSLAYVVPDANECKRCHGKANALPLGFRSEQLDRNHDYPAGAENQIAYFARVGLLDNAPAAVPAPVLVAPSDTSAPLEWRARSYLFANCAHCHSKERGAAEWSGLSLELANTAKDTLEPCRIVTSAGDTGGLTFDIVPGHPDESILPYRMGLERSAYRMPEGSRTADKDGVALIRAWIAAMPPRECR